MYPTSRQNSAGVQQPSETNSQPLSGPTVGDRPTTAAAFTSSLTVQPLYTATRPYPAPPLLRPDTFAPSLAAMCSPNHNALLTYAGLKVPTPSPYFSLNPAASQLSALDFHRSQFCDYRQLLNIRQYQALHASGLGPYAAYLDPYTQYLYKGDPRARFVQEEPKPSHSYIGLIAMAILSSKEKKLVLSDIYQWILDNYPYFRTRGPGWRNSIRHNLSLNDCFIKSGRSANGKGHFWAVHPANVDDFTRGDFRRRRAQRKVRKHMGLSVPDDDEDSPSPSPNPISWAHGGQDTVRDVSDDFDNNNVVVADSDGTRSVPVTVDSMPGTEGSADVQTHHGFVPLAGRGTSVPHVSKKRLFDMDSILAPDYPVVMVPKVQLLSSTVSPITPQQQGLSDLDSVTSEQRHGSHSDESDIDIEGEDGIDVEQDAEIDKECLKGMDTDRRVNQASGQSPQAEDPDMSGGEDAELKTDEKERSPKLDDRSSHLVQSSLAVPIPCSEPCPSLPSDSSALDLTSSSIPSSTMTSMAAMSSDPAVTSMSMMAVQTLMLPRGLDGSQRARWTGLGMGMGMGMGIAGVGLGAPSPELGLRRYSAFHAAGGGGNPGGLRGSLPPSVAPFLHPVFAAARYPSLVPLPVSSSSSSSSTASGPPPGSEMTSRCRPEDVASAAAAAAAAAAASAASHQDTADRV